MVSLIHRGSKTITLLVGFTFPRRQGVTSTSTGGVEEHMTIVMPVAAALEEVAV